MNARISDALERGGGEIRCRSCGQGIALAGTAWKSAAALEEVPMRGAGGGAYDGGDRVLLRRFCCPGCGALLDCETALAGDPFLDDIVYG